MRRLSRRRLTTGSAAAGHYTAVRRTGRSELAALKVARGTGKGLFAAGIRTPFAGDDLVALAHLCVAQMWQPCIRRLEVRFGRRLHRLTRQQRHDCLVQLRLTNARQPESQRSGRRCGYEQTMLRTVPMTSLLKGHQQHTPLLHFIAYRRHFELLAQRQAILLELSREYAQADEAARNSAACSALCGAFGPGHAVYESA